jgi:hypothetical protein
MELPYSNIALRIIGDDLVPEEITALLGALPTSAVIKGEKGKHITGPKVGYVRVARSGMWIFEAPDRELKDMNGQIREILSQMTDDLAVWQGITKRYRVDLFCGLFLSDYYGGVTLSPESLAALGERGIKMGLCIYAEGREVLPNDPCPCRSGKSYAECCGLLPSK